VTLGPNAFIQPSGIVDASRFVIRGPDGSEASISELREGFRQGFVFELIDVTRPATPLAVHVMVLNPVRYTLSEPFQITLTPAEDDTVVSEGNGIIVREITLEGTYGISDKRARGFIGAQGSGNPLSGTEHFNALRNLFRRYSALKKDPNASANTLLLFHALRDDDHFVIEPRSFETPRDAGRNRTHYEYRIQLAAIDEATVSSLRRAPDQSGFNFNDALRDINEGFNDGRAAFAEVTANLSNIKRQVGNIQAVMGNAAQMLNSVGNFITGVTQLIEFPFQLASTVTDQLATAADTLIDVTSDSIVSTVETVTFRENSRSLRRMEAAIDRIAMYDDKFQAFVQRIETAFDGERRITNADVASSGQASAPGAGGVTVGSRTRVVGGSDGRLAGLEVPRGTGLRGVRITRTDTVESIATQAGTTPEAIIIINNLLPPYITPDGGPGLLAPGDSILVPSAQVSTESHSGNGSIDYLTAEEALYGVDIAIDDKVFSLTGQFDIAVDEVAGAEDVALRRGVSNVVQGTEITINTEKGATVFIPTLGIRRNVGVAGTLQHVLLASITLREALLSDPRVSAVQSSRVVLTGDVLSQEITAVISNQQPGATFVLPFGRASSGE
jgi:hypothetical protein